MSVGLRNEETMARRFVIVTILLTMAMVMIDIPIATVTATTTPGTVTTAKSHSQIKMTANLRTQSHDGLYDGNDRDKSSQLTTKNIIRRRKRRTIESMPSSQQSGSQMETEMEETKIMTTIPNDEQRDNELDTEQLVQVEFTYPYQDTEQDVLCFVPTSCLSPTSSTISCPLYIWLDGTDIPWFGRESEIDEIDKMFLRYMANTHGYVSCNPQYVDNVFLYLEGCGEFSNNNNNNMVDTSQTEGSFHAKSRAIFDPTLPNSVISQVCGSNVYANCTEGIRVHGFSQGAHIATLASQYTTDIKAALLFGNGRKATLLALELPCMDNSVVQSTLDRSRRRYITGENDIVFSPAVEQTADISGYDSSTECDSMFDCIQTDNGSGYYIIPDKGHDFFVVNAASLEMDPMFLDPSNVWSLSQNLDWLANR